MKFNYSSIGGSRGFNSTPWNMVKPFHGTSMHNLSSVLSYPLGLAMMLEAQARGWEIHTFDSSDMFYSGNKVCALTKITKVQDSETNWHSSEPSDVTNLESMDVVFMRKDPPFDMDYIYSTYLLEQKPTRY